MSYATLMVHLDLDQENDARLSVVGDLAERFTARVIGVAAQAEPVYYADDVDAARFVAEDLREMEDNLAGRYSATSVHFLDVRGAHSVSPSYSSVKLLRSEGLKMNEQRELHDSVVAWASRINESWQGTVRNIVETGKALIDAKADLPHGAFTEMVETDLLFSTRTAQRLMAIAEHPSLSNPTHVSVLPASWGTLYELSKIDGCTVEKLIQAGRLNAKTFPPCCRRRRPKPKPRRLRHRRGAPIPRPLSRSRWSSPRRSILLSPLRKRRRSSTLNIR